MVCYAALLLFVTASNRYEVERLLLDHFQWYWTGPAPVSSPGLFPLQIYKSECPSNGRSIARVQEGTLEEYSAAVDRTRQAWDTWVEVNRAASTER